MAIGWLDPFSLLVRSIGLSILPAFNFTVRAVLAPMENSHIAPIKATGEITMRSCSFWCWTSDKRILRRVLRWEFSFSSFCRPACASRACGAARFARLALF